MATVSWSTFKLTVTEATGHAVAAEYPHSTHNGTPICKNHSGTVLYETHIARHEESECVFVEPKVFGKVMFAYWSWCASQTKIGHL